MRKLDAITSGSKVGPPQGLDELGCHQQADGAAVVWVAEGPQDICGMLSACTAEPECAMAPLVWRVNEDLQDIKGPVLGATFVHQAYTINETGLNSAGQRPKVTGGLALALLERWAFLGVLFHFKGLGWPWVGWVGLGIKCP